jgi:hypothetical protein
MVEMEDYDADQVVLVASTEVIALTWVSQRLPSKDVQWALEMV